MKQGSSDSPVNSPDRQDMRRLRNGWIAIAMFVTGLVCPPSVMFVCYALSQRNGNIAEFIKDVVALPILCLAAILEPVPRAGFLRQNFCG